MSYAKITESEYMGETTTIEMARANGYRQAIMDMMKIMEERNLDPIVSYKIFNDLVTKSMRIELPQNSNLYDKL